MNIIFAIDGGLGKNIMGTAVLAAIRKQYKKANIIVVSGHKDVFLNNPNVNEVLKNSSHIYKNYLQNDDCKVFIADPYHTSDYITESNHLIKIWCDMFNIEYNGEMPELFLSEVEKQYFEPFYKLDKPIMAIQPNGGNASQSQKYSWVRDIPSLVVEEIIEHYKKDYSIVHVKQKDQITYKYTRGALDSFRSIAIMLLLSKKRLFIDSSAMHIATALNLPSVVTWVGTNPKVFGYKIHTNITANLGNKPLDLNHAFYKKLQLVEDISKIPYHNLNNIFDTSVIINELEKIPGSGRAINQI